MRGRDGTVRWARRRLALAVLPVLLAASCGDGGFDRADADAARRTLSGWAAAWASHDGPAACRLLTPRMRERWNRHEEGCARAVGRLSAIDGGLRVRRVEVAPDWEGNRDGRMRGIVLFTRTGGEAAGGETGGEVALRKAGGRWLLEEDLSCIVPGC